MDFDHELKYFIDQEAIDIHYSKMKQEVKTWIIEYTEAQKKLTEEQRARIMAYANAISFLQTGELNAYIQDLPTVSKKEKKRLERYLQQVEWLPKGQSMGMLDGHLVSRIPPRDPLLEKLLNTSKNKEAE